MRTHRGFYQAARIEACGCTNSFCRVGQALIDENTGDPFFRIEAIKNRVKYPPGWYARYRHYSIAEQDRHAQALR